MAKQLIKAGRKSIIVAVKFHTWSKLDSVDIGGLRNQRCLLVGQLEAAFQLAEHAPPRRLTDPRQDG